MVDSEQITLQQGVRLRLVLSPMVFLIVMDSLLVELANALYSKSILDLLDMQMISGAWL